MLSNHLWEKFEENALSVIHLDHFPVYWNVRVCSDLRERLRKTPLIQSAKRKGKMAWHIGSGQSYLTSAAATVEFKRRVFRSSVLHCVSAL